MDTKTSPISLLNDPTLLKTDALINGQWVRGSQRFAVHDPATGAKLADVANLGPLEAQAAIDAAQAAWAGWRNKTGKERSILLRKWYDLLMANVEDLGRLMTAEQGKPFAEAKGEVVYGASFVEWYAEEAKRVNGETLPQFDNNRRLLVLRQPIGVCAAITPWNFPLAMITRKVAPALAAGCPVVIKPAELTPLTALAAAELAVRAGIPAGVINILTADSDNSVAVGKVFCASDTVRHISFTGSTEVGRILMAQSAPTVKKLSLELGGNAPFIVFDDADYEKVVAQMESIAPYALTGAVIAQDRRVIEWTMQALRFAAGNFYVNDKPTGAVVGQQPFGGGRASGTNDKAGAPQNLLRWVSPRAIKETFVPPTDYRYPFLGEA